MLPERNAENMSDRTTQMLSARAGIITKEIAAVAEAEQRTADFILERVADGRIVIPANIMHKNLIPMGIGRELTTKINANIGTSPLSGCAQTEKQKLADAIRYGADTVMDLSTGGNIARIREIIIEASTVPLGTVPIYGIVAEHGADFFSAETILNTIYAQAKQGVDYMTIHAGLLSHHLDAALKRKLGIVSRGGSLIARWMKRHQQENPFYTTFDDILNICLEYDVTLSLGDGLRPGCLEDASDEAQFAELDVLGELVTKCRKAGVQAMVEGPGHIPYNEIEMNMKREQQVCGDAPFYILGPVVTDCAPGYDHITAAIGGTAGAYYGAAMLCYVTPMEHLGLPQQEDVRNGVIAFKIAAHAADVALKKPGAIRRDSAMADARAAFNWEQQFNLALDPDRAREFRQRAVRAAETPQVHDSRFCTMCGPDFCSMRISAELQKKD